MEIPNGTHDTTNINLEQKCNTFTDFSLSGFTGSVTLQSSVVMADSTIIEVLISTRVFTEKLVIFLYVNRTRCRIYCIRMSFVILHFMKIQSSFKVKTNSGTGAYLIQNGEYFNSYPTK